MMAQHSLRAAWLSGLVFGVTLTGLLAGSGLIGCQRSRSKNSEQSDEKPTPAPALPPQSPEELGQPLAQIDDVVITVGEFQERINRQSPYIRARYTSLEQKKEFLDNLIRFEVLAKEGFARGFDKDPDVVRTMKQVMIQKLMKDEFENKFKPEDIDDAEMQTFYKEHETEYNKPEEVRVSAIILKSKTKAEQVAREALGAAGSSNKGFRELVSKYSTDEKTKIRGGDLRYFARDSQEIPQVVIAASFDLKKTGDVAGPIAVDGAYYIIKQTGKRKAVVKTFDDVKRQIQNRIYRDKRTQAQKDFIDGLRQKAKIKVFEDKLARVRVDTSTAEAADASHAHGRDNLPGFPGPEPAPLELDPPAESEAEATP
jgi:peptidyl-prolyl cis-trans isomerase C